MENLITEVKDLLFTSDTVTNLVDTDLAEVTVKLKPRSDEQRHEGKSGHFSKEVAQNIVDELVSLGFKFNWTSSLVGNEHYHRLTNGKVSIQLHFVNTLSKEEECAKLKERLAELGCQY